MDITTKLLIFIVLAIILTKIPIIGKYFGVVNTLVHELGHLIVSYMTFGKGHKIELFANKEGLAFSSHRFWIGKVMTTLAGYLFSSFMAFLFYYLLFLGKYQSIIYILLIMLGVSLLFWIRNLYGFCWVLTFSGGFVWLLWKADTPVIENTLLFLISIVLVESITSSFEIMYLSFKTPKQAGDASSLANLTRIVPSQIWGIFFFTQSLYFGWLAMRLFFPFLEMGE